MRTTFLDHFSFNFQSFKLNDSMISNSNVVKWITSDYYYNECPIHHPILFVFFISDKFHLGKTKYILNHPQHFGNRNGKLYEKYCLFYDIFDSLCTMWNRIIDSYVSHLTSGRWTCLVYQFDWKLRLIWQW